MVHGACVLTIELLIRLLKISFPFLLLMNYLMN